MFTKTTAHIHPIPPTARDVTHERSQARTEEKREEHKAAQDNANDGAGAERGRRLVARLTVADVAALTRASVGACRRVKEARTNKAFRHLSMTWTSSPVPKNQGMLTIQEERQSWKTRTLKAEITYHMCCYRRRAGHTARTRRTHRRLCTSVHLP